ncbi:MAG: transcription elongation factor GreA [Holosporales bacterium]|jgi:transcription elongation factor GreA|nr:transcription elongation factor GreA [Holosporales bacterium]
MDRIPLTVGGYQKILEELQHLKNEERPQIINAIASARELGDLSENAEYHSAKERQGMIESRISDLEDQINRAEIVDVSKIEAKDIRFGATVTLIDVETKNQMSFQIVGSIEANIKNGYLPVTSPLAKALIGRTTGDMVEVITPGGMKTYEILKVRYI